MENHPKDIKVLLNNKNLTGEQVIFGFNTYTWVHTGVEAIKSLRDRHNVIFESGIRESEYPVAFIPDTEHNRKAIIGLINANVLFLGNPDLLTMWGYDRVEPKGKLIEVGPVESKIKLLEESRGELMSKAVSMGLPNTEAFKLSKVKLAEWVSTHANSGKERSNDVVTPKGSDKGFGDGADD